MPNDPTTIPQLVILFNVEGDLSERPDKITVQVSFPGGDTREIDVAANFASGPTLPERVRWTIRAPVLFQNIVLKPGRVEAKIKYKDDELAVAGAWILLATSPSTSAQRL